MGLIKNGSTSATPEVKSESGVEAAIARLQQPAQKIDIPKVDGSKYAKPRDFDKEAKGKTKCVQYAAALSSPALAGLPFKSAEELMVLVRKFADDGVKYSFED